MKSPRAIHPGLAVSEVIIAVATVWGGPLAAEPPKAPEPVAKRPVATTQTLGGADRYLTHLSTDKPVYRVGDTVYMRGVILHHATRKPLSENAQASALVELKGPKGDTIASGFVSSAESVLGFSWTIPDGQAGGEYTLHVSFPAIGFAPAERKFDIRAYRAPRLKTQIRFLRDGYGPGDAVVAALEAHRAEGGVPAGAAVTVIARVDGEEVYRGPSQVDARGNCEARFKLPAEIRRGEGTLAMVIEDGGVVETASKTIPILLQTVDLTVYPEGGDLVAGHPNRVYFEAFTPAKKPADLAGVVTDADGREVANFRSEHEGRGRFTFTPMTGGAYRMKITEPAGIKTEYPLHEVKSQGVVLTSLDDVTDGGKPVGLAVSSTGGGDYTLTLSQRETEVAAARLKFQRGGRQTLRLDPGVSDGVLIATVWDAQNKPLAERLVFRRPTHAVQVKIAADADRYVPGGSATVTIRTTDDAGKPVTAMVGLAVTDDSVLEMIEKRVQVPRLPVMVLLEDDVKELADAHVYLDPANAKAPLATDLLLGTQGWRRFALVDAAAFIAASGDQARRALALRMESVERQLEVWRRAGAMNGMEGGPPPMPAMAMPAGAPPAAPMAPGAPIPADEAPPPALAMPMPEAPPAEPPPAAQPAPAAEAAEMPMRVPATVPAIPPQPMDADRQRLDLAVQAADEKAARKWIARDELEVIRNDFVSVRVYAHQVRSGRQPGERIDFAETLFWHVGIATDATTGEATVQFGFSDAVSSFRVFADAFSGTGALGAGTLQIESVEPFYVEPKMPLEVTSGDQILLPIGLVNATIAPLAGGTLAVESPAALRPETSSLTFELKPDQRVRKLLAIDVGPYNDTVGLILSAKAGPYADRVTRTLSIKPRGFPVEAGVGGMLAAGGTASHEVVIPAELVEGSVESRAVVYPTPLANLTEALARLIQEPYGCFEQTSSTTYPLVMAQQYFQSHTGVDPDLVKEAAETLSRGYDRLTGFECKGRGYEWFAEDPGHEALTAFGLMEFVDMGEVFTVDAAMLDRTRAWLLATRDGQGGFSRNRRALHTWIVDADCSNAYIVWALMETGESPEGLQREVAWVRNTAEKTDNSYVAALGANVLALAGDADGANRLLDRLAGKQAADGSVEGATTSIVGSGGESLLVETTSLAVLAWLKNPRYAGNVEKSMQYLAEVCKAGRFGSTQSTVLALKAIVEYDKSRARPKAPGSLSLVIDGQAVGEPVRFSPDDQGALELPDFSKLLTPGKHAVEIRMQAGSDMPYSLAVNYHTLKPATAPRCKVHLDASLRDKQVDEGAVTEARVAVVNSTNQPVPTPVAIIGLPGGLEPRHDQLKELVKSGKIDAYEVLGRDVVLYWRSLAAEQRVELPISLVAAIPGRFTGPASRTYLYYTDEDKSWVDGLRVEIRPQAVP